MKLEILRPHVLLLIPAFMLLLGLCVYLCQTKKRDKILGSFILHGIAGTLLLLALGGVSVMWRTRAVTTVYIADLSDSAKFYQERAEEFIRESIRMTPEDEYAAIVTFGAESRLEQFAGNLKTFTRFESIPNRTATNIEEAVTTAMSLLTGDTAKRIVLITDGFQNSGSLEDTIPALASEKVDVKAVQIEKEDTGELYIGGMDIPSKVSAGDRFTIDVEVVSNRSATAMLYLYSEDRIKARTQVELSVGANHFVFEDVRRDGGLVTYRANIEALEDTETANNVYYAYTNIQAAPRILVVKGERGSAEEFEKLLGAINIDYKTVLSGQAPESMDKMLEYKSIIAVDVYYDNLNKGFTELIEPYVKDFGGGIIAIGGENSFALGNYRDTPMETVLPVSMGLAGEKEVPPIAMALVIDRSGSMGGGDGRITKLALAKEAAIKALDELRSIDSIGVVSFDDGYYWTSEFRPADYRDEVASAVAGITEGGGTSIYPALKAASDTLKAQDAPLRHIILLTDGQDSFTDYQPLIDEMNSYGITLSAISVGEDADAGLLAHLAQSGNGRYYHTDINTNIPRIFAQEVYLSTRSYLINRRFTPVISGNHEILGTAGIRSLPPMLGYIASTRKEYADALIESDTGDPVLTVWQYGLGRAAAFNSDAENRWTAHYANWELYPALWKNIIDFTAANMDEPGGNAAIESEGAFASVTYTTDDYGADTLVSGVYTGEGGSTGEFVLYPEAPGAFRGVFPTPETGVYSVNIRKQEGTETSGSLNTAYVMQYSMEYRFEDNQNVLPVFLDRVSGKSIKSPTEVFEGGIDMVRSGMNAADFLLISAIIIFVADVARRRLNWKFSPAKKMPAPDKTSDKLEEIQRETGTGDDAPRASGIEGAADNKNIKKTNKKPKRKEDHYLDTNELLHRKQERGRNR